MRVLDVGCGAGDVSFLAAELVGHAGKVVGADISDAAIRCATRRAEKLGVASVQFVLGDPALMEVDDKFDAVVGRLVLMYYPDPVEALRRLARHLRRGGMAVFQEFDMSSMRSFPPVPTFDLAVDVMKEAFQASGAHVNIGIEVNSIFVEAGLPEPSLRMDAVVGGASFFPYDIVAATIDSLMPRIDRLHLASCLELERLQREQHMRDEAAACRGVAFSPGLIGAWSRVEA
jgi:SAM-dependent methyltransferase